MCSSVLAESLEEEESSPCVVPQRWLKQALEEEGSTSPIRRPGLMMPTDGPLSPPINGDSDSPLPYNGSCCLPGMCRITRGILGFCLVRWAWQYSTSIYQLSLEVEWVLT